MNPITQQLTHPTSGQNPLAPVLFPSCHYSPLSAQALREQVLETALSRWEAANPQSYTEAERQQAIQQFWQQQQVATATEQAGWLHSHCLTSEQLQKLALREFRLLQFKQAQWNDQISAYFLQRQPDLEQVGYSLIRVKEAELAHQLYTQIQAGKAFAELARLHSQGAEAKTGGFMGSVPLHRPHPVIRKILAESQAGEVSSPRVIENWAVIIRLEYRIEASLDQTIRQRLLNELFDRWLQAEAQAASAISIPFLEGQSRSVRFAT